MTNKLIRTVLLVACATLFPLAVSADPQLIPNKYEDATKTAESNLNTSLVGSLTDLAKTPDDNRFGTNKPLGFYYAGHNLQYKSPYAKLPAKTIAEFALALHDFLLRRQADLPAMKKRLSTHRHARTRQHRSGERQSYAVASATIRSPRSPDKGSCLLRQTKRICKNLVVKPRS